MGHQEREGSGDAQRPPPGMDAHRCRDPSSPVLKGVSFLLRGSEVLAQGGGGTGAFLGQRLGVLGSCAAASGASW